MPHSSQSGQSNKGVAMRYLLYASLSERCFYLTTKEQSD